MRFYLATLELLESLGVQRYMRVRDRLRTNARRQERSAYLDQLDINLAENSFVRAVGALKEFHQTSVGARPG